MPATGSRSSDQADGAIAGAHDSPISSSFCSLVAVMFAPHLPPVAICPWYASKSANPATAVLAAAELFLSWRALFPIGMIRA
jgi:hypothetical protein